MPKRPRRKKLNVPPGKAITPNDLPGTSKDGQEEEDEQEVEAEQEEENEPGRIDALIDEVLQEEGFDNVEEAIENSEQDIYQLHQLDDDYQNILLISYLYNV